MINVRSRDHYQTVCMCGIIYESCAINSFDNLKIFIFSQKHERFPIIFVLIALYQHLRSLIKFCFLIENKIKTIYFVFFVISLDSCII